MHLRIHLPPLAREVAWPSWMSISSWASTDVDEMQMDLGRRLMLLAEGIMYYVHLLICVWCVWIYNEIYQKKILHECSLILRCRNIAIICKFFALALAPSALMQDQAGWRKSEVKTRLLQSWDHQRKIEFHFSWHATFHTRRLFSHT